MEDLLEPTTFQVTHVNHVTWSVILFIRKLFYNVDELLFTMEVEMNIGWEMNHKSWQLFRTDKFYCRHDCVMHVLSFIVLQLTHWGRATHICVSKVIIIIGSDNGLSPGRHQAIIWTSAGLLLFRRKGTIFSEILIEIRTS